MESFFWFDLLRYWIYLSAVASVVEFWQCYQVDAGQARIKAVYPRADWQETSHLAARQLGLNHALLVLIRVYGGIFLEDEYAFNVCRWSFVIVLFHFIWERVGTRTIDSKNLSITEGVALVSIVWMYTVNTRTQETPVMHPGMFGGHHPMGF